MSAGTSAAQSSATGTSPVRLRAIAVGAAIVSALVVWGIGKAMGAELEIGQGEGKSPMEIGLGTVAFSVLFVSLLGWGVLALLEKFVPGKALTIWTALASVVALLSLLPVFASESTAGTKALLPLVHLTVAAVLIPLMRRSAVKSR